MSPSHSILFPDLIHSTYSLYYYITLILIRLKPRWKLWSLEMHVEEIERGEHNRLGWMDVGR